MGTESSDWCLSELGEDSVDREIADRMSDYLIQERENKIGQIA